MKYPIPVFLVGSLWLLFASDPGTGDWPMWGGTPDRNPFGSKFFSDFAHYIQAGCSTWLGGRVFLLSRARRCEDDDRVVWQSSN